ncbi:MAG: glycosyltransferase [Pirellulales bacterium]
MKVWLLHIGEDLPVDGPQRLFRYGYLANALQAHGHSVLRWAPTFRHTTREQRFTTDRRVELTPHYSIQFVHAPGYRRTASLARLRHCHILGKRFGELVRRESPPDLIVAAIPSLEWADAATAYGRVHDVPTVVDVRDLWPDVFPSALPYGTRSLSSLFLHSYRRMARRACSRADALCAVSETYLSWALKHAGRTRRVGDLAVPLGFEPADLPEDALHGRITELVERGIDPRRPICFFAGGFERHHDFDAIVGAARMLAARDTDNVQFVLCGGGSKLTAIRRQTAGMANFHLLGHVDAAMLRAVASISVIGLCAYAPGAMMSLGNKPYEYMAGRLALVSSLPGELAQLLDRHNCGLTYRAGDGDSLAGCIAELLQHPERLAAMRDNARATWASHYRSRDVYDWFVAGLTSVARTMVKAA